MRKFDIPDHLLSPTNRCTKKHGFLGSLMWKYINDDLETRLGWPAAVGGSTKVPRALPLFFYFFQNKCSTSVSHKQRCWKCPAWMVGLNDFLTSLRNGMNKVGGGGGGGVGGWQLLECWWPGKLWATSLLQVAVRGGSPARQEIAGEGKEGLTTTTDTREKKQDTGGIHKIGVLF